MTDKKRKKRKTVKISNARRARNLFWGTVALAISIPLTLIAQNPVVFMWFAGVGYVCIKENAMY